MDLCRILDGGRLRFKHPNGDGDNYSKAMEITAVEPFSLF